MPSRFRAEYSGNTIEEVCNIDTDLYNEELNTSSNEIFVQICLKLANLQQKIFPNKWSNAVMGKFTRASITSSSDLKHYIVSKTLNPRLINAGGSGLYPITQKGLLALIDNTRIFVRGGTKEFVPNAFLLTTNTSIVYQRFPVLSVSMVHNFHL